MKLHVELDGDSYAAGETVGGRVHVAAGGAARSLEVMLNFIEETPDYTAVARSVKSGTLHSGELRTGQLIDFALELPADALPNAGSEHAELYWEVAAHSDELGLDTHARARIEVAAPK